MKKITTIGLGLAKRVFQVRAADAAAAVVLTEAAVSSGVMGPGSRGWIETPAFQFPICRPSTHRIFFLRSGSYPHMSR